MMLQSVFKSVGSFILAKSKKTVLFFIAFAVVLVCVSIVRGFVFGVDFVGGNIVDFKPYSEVLEMKEILDEKVGKILESDRFVLQPAKDGSYLLRTNPDIKMDSVKDAIWKVFGDVELNQVEEIGPQVGSTLIKQSLFAICFSFLTMILYLLLRFNVPFAMSGVIVLFINFIVSVGLTSLFKIELNLTTVVAYLTLVGYGINDTVVLYDRIRGNLVSKPGKKVSEVVAISITETFGRSIITSFVTILSLVGVVLFSQSAIRGFAIITTCGIVVSTIGSVCVASVLPIWFKLQRQKPKNVNKKDPMFYAS